MANLSDKRLALYDALTGFTAEGFRVYRHWPDTVTTPAILIRPADEEFMTKTSWSDSWTYRFFVEVIIGAAASDARAQETLDGWLETSGVDSIVAALQGIRGAVVLGVRNYSGRRIGEVSEFVGVTIPVEMV